MDRALDDILIKVAAQQVCLLMRAAPIGREIAASGPEEDQMLAPYYEGQHATFGKLVCIRYAHPLCHGSAAIRNSALGRD